jgi:hypothetical protein
LVAAPRLRREDLTRALEERRAVQATLMRSTIHTVSAEDYPLFAAGLRKARREWWQRVAGRNLGDFDMAQAIVPLRERLERGPARTEELKALLVADGAPAIAWQGVGLWLDLVRVPPSVAGTWRYEAGAVRVSPFEPISAEVRHELDREAQALAFFHAEVGDR